MDFQGPGLPGTTAPRVDAATALFGVSDLLKSPVSDVPVFQMKRREVEAEMRGIQRWITKQTQTTPEVARAESRYQALERRMRQLGTPLADQRGHKKAAATVPRPRSLDPGFDPLTLSKDEAAAEHDAILTYLRTSPPKAEVKRLNAARLLFEDTMQQEAAQADEAVRQRDILVALTPKSSGDLEQMNEVLATIQGIRPDPDAPGQWILRSGGMVIPLADEEVKQLRAEVRKQMSRTLSELSSLNDNAYNAFEERRHKNKEHPFVHGLVKFTSGVDDLDELEIFGLQQNNASLEKHARKFLDQGKFTDALHMANVLDAGATGLANKVGEWESSLVSTAGRWVLALTILKEGLTLLATAGAAGLTTKLAKGVGYVRATLTVGSATTAAGALGAGGGSAVSELATGGTPTFGKTFHAVRVGGGAGLAIGATPGVVGGAKELAGVREGVMTVSNVGRAVAAETIANTGVNVAAATLSGESKTDALKGSLVGAPISAVGGIAVGHIAAGSKPIAAVGGAVVGATGNTASAFAQGKEGRELKMAAAFGALGGGAGPYLADAPQYKTKADVHGKFDVTDQPLAPTEATPDTPGTTRTDKSGFGFDVSDTPGPSSGPKPAPTTTASSTTASSTPAPAVVPDGGPSARTVGTGDETTGTGSSAKTVGTSDETGGGTAGTASTSGGAPTQEQWMGQTAHSDVPLKPGGPGVSIGRGAAGGGVEYAQQTKGRFKTVGKPGEGISESVIVQDTQSGKKFLFKPLGGEKAVPYAEERGVTAVNIAPRAKAAEVSAEALGVQTPHVELVVINGRKGSLTEWIDGTQSFGKWAQANPAEFAALKQTSEYAAAMADIHALDYLINNLDRVQNTNNYLIEFTPEGKFKALIPINSELSFTSTQMRAIVPQKTSGLPKTYAPALAAKLAKLHADPSAFTAQISPLVGERAIPGVLSRLNEMYNDALARGFIK